MSEKSQSRLPDPYPITWLGVRRMPYPAVTLTYVEAVEGPFGHLRGGPHEAAFLRLLELAHRADELHPEGVKEALSDNLEAYFPSEHPYPGEARWLQRNPDRAITRPWQMMAMHESDRRYYENVKLMNEGMRRDLQKLLAEEADQVFREAVDIEVARLGVKHCPFSRPTLTPCSIQSRPTPSMPPPQT